MALLFASNDVKTALCLLAHVYQFLDIGELYAATLASQNKPLMAIAFKDFLTIYCVRTLVLILTFHIEPTGRLITQLNPIEMHSNKHVSWLVLVSRLWLYKLAHAKINIKL